MEIRRSLPILIFLLLSPLCAVAQHGRNTELRELSLEELMKTHVISSTQRAMELQKAPSTIYVVTGEQIRRWGIRRLSELIDRFIPGAHACEDGDDVILGFRGIASDNNAKVLLLFNGRQYNAQWNNGPNSEVELGFLSDIKRIEVIVGPGSALYGSGATIGVINLITRTGSDFSGARVFGNFGTGDYRKGEFLAGGHLNEDTDIFFSMGGLAADGYDNNHNGPLRISRYPPGYRFFSDLRYKNYQLMTRFTRSSRAFYNLPHTDTTPDIYTNYDTLFLDFRREFPSRNQWKFELGFAYDTLQTQRHDFRLGTKLRAVGEDRYEARFRGFYSGLPAHSFVFGAEYRRDEFGDDWYGDNFNFTTRIQNGMVTGIPADPDQVRTISPYGRNVYAAYLQDDFTVHDRVSILLGFRFDRIEAPQIETPSALTPRAAVVYQPDSRTILKLMYTSGFRQPIAVLTSPDPLAFGGATETRIEEPERMSSLEISASRNLTPRLNVSGVFFYNSLRDLHGLDPRALAETPRRFVFVSAGRIDFTGFEAILSLNPTSQTFARIFHQHVQFGSTVNDVFAILATPGEKRIFPYPEDVTKAMFEAQIANRISANANMNVVWRHFGVDFDRTRLETGTYVLLNANAVIRLTNQLDLILSGYNLTGTDQVLPITVLGRSIPAGRNWNLGIDFRL